MKEIDINCDFRKQPKTQTFCAVCQKDLNQVQQNVYWVAGCTFAHPDHLEGDELLVPVGNECVKKFPAEYVVRK